MTLLWSECVLCCDGRTRWVLPVGDGIRYGRRLVYWWIQLCVIESGVRWETLQSEKWVSKHQLLQFCFRFAAVCMSICQSVFHTDVSSSVKYSFSICCILLICVYISCVFLKCTIKPLSTLDPIFSYIFMDFICSFAKNSFVQHQHLLLNGC